MAKIRITANVSGKGFEYFICVDCLVNVIKIVENTNGVIHNATKLSNSCEVVRVNYKHNDGYCKAFGKQLRKLREAKGLSMRGLAREADIEYSQLSKIERGVINTTISTVQALAHTLNIPTKDLFDFEFPAKD